MARLIDADALQAELLRMEFFPAMVMAAIRRTPTVDAVPAAAYEQVKWERDVAMKQLEEHGIPFGGVAPDVVEVCRCKDCEFFDKTGYEDVNAEIDMPELHTGYCSVWKQITQACGYCSCGERREGE